LLRTVSVENIVVAIILHNQFTNKYLQAVRSVNIIVNKKIHNLATSKNLHTDNSVKKYYCTVSYSVSTFIYYQYINIFCGKNRAYYIYSCHIYFATFYLLLLDLGGVKILDMLCYKMRGD
jgi:hypothetical protein